MKTKQLTKQQQKLIYLQFIMNSRIDKDGYQVHIGINKSIDCKYDVPYYTEKYSYIENEGVNDMFEKAIKDLKETHYLQGMHCELIEMNEKNKHYNDNHKYTGLGIKSRYYLNSTLNEINKKGMENFKIKLEKQLQDIHKDFTIEEPKWEDYTEIQFLIITKGKKQFKIKFSNRIDTYIEDKDKDYELFLSEFYICNWNKDIFTREYIMENTIEAIKKFYKIKGENYVLR